MNRLRRNLSSLLGILAVSFVFAGVSWGVHKWRAGSVSAKVQQEETSAAEAIVAAGFGVVSFEELRKISLEARADFFYEAGHLPCALNLDVGGFDERLSSLAERFSSVSASICRNGTQCPHGGIFHNIGVLFSELQTGLHPGD